MAEKKNLTSAGGARWPLGRGGALGEIQRWLASEKQLNFVNFKIPNYLGPRLALKLALQAPPSSPGYNEAVPGCSSPGSQNLPLIFNILHRVKSPSLANIVLISATAASMVK